MFQSVTKGFLFSRPAKFAHKALMTTLTLSLSLLCVGIGNAQGENCYQSVTVRSGGNQNIRFIQSNGCGQPLSSSPFTAATFSAAQAGAPAVAIAPLSPPWIASLPCDPEARWISVNANRGPRSALFAQPFNLSLPGPVVSATLTFCWAVDDSLGDMSSGGPNPAGVYINGVPTVPIISGGNFGAQTTMTVNIPAGTLVNGTNWLYVYNRDIACVVSGVIYSATIRVVSVCCRNLPCQPWNDCLPSQISIVRDCNSPNQPFLNLPIAMDDWQADYTGNFNTVHWWGVALDPLMQQRTRPFMIAIYREGENCRPFVQQPVYVACVKPVSRLAGTDCQGQRVWQFRAILPGGGFNQVAGAKYWIQISEVDAFSVRREVPDFAWSGHRACERNCLCPALRFIPGAVTEVISNCDDRPMDLSFCFKRTAITIASDNPNHNSPLRVSVRLPGSNETLWEGTEDFAPGGDVDGDGLEDYLMLLSPDLPDGEYEIVMEGGGALKETRRVMLGQDGLLLPYRPVLGDLNGDDSIDDEDLLQVLFNFGRSAR
ncbi:MAG: hypothetical protein KIT45_02945 [Fimbriimonadia bacterium]|nr:hypothetical protein [Fimbriimonadia bacterium]